MPCRGLLINQTEMAALFINCRSLCESVIDNLMELRPCSSITMQYIFHMGLSINHVTRSNGQWVRQKVTLGHVDM